MIGDPGTIRTYDQQLRRLLLYPLSYGAELVGHGNQLDSRLMMSNGAGPWLSPARPMYVSMRPGADAAELEIVRIGHGLARLLLRLENGIGDAVLRRVGDGLFLGLER